MQELGQRAAQVRSDMAQAGFVLSGGTLSQLALAVLLNLPGVSCVLNGMRRASYVDDSLAAAQIKVDDPVGLMRRLRGPAST